ncbi:MAG TPA: crossover junction endodeoxyribonuclease RuvC, partial [Candidatus Methylomirabilis sp.]
QQMVKRTLGLAELPKPADVGDALAIALCHIYCHPGREKFDLRP